MAHRGLPRGFLVLALALVCTLGAQVTPSSTTSVKTKGAAKARTKCGTGLTECPNTKPLFCILSDWVCDGINQCPKGVDEVPSVCKTYNCTATGRVACPPYKGQSLGVCIQPDQICDGEPDCPYGTDETVDNCSKYKCSTSGRAQCPSGTGCMTRETQKCDGSTDCADGSDEKPDFCGAFNCTKTPSKFLGNFQKTFPNRPVHTWRVPCPSSSKCLDSDNNLCDGLPDCPKGTDETVKFCSTFDCASANKIACPGTKAGSAKTCIWADSLCDGTSDCPNGSDEASSFCSSLSCPKGTVKCKSNTCAYGAMCNGKKDCGDASDEDPTTCAKFSCPSGSVKCGDGKQCILATAACDGKVNCKDGSDETAARCKK